MKYTVVRYYFRYGNEWDEVDNTYSRDFSSFEKALQHGHRYAKGCRFEHFEICDSDTMETLYSESYTGDIDDYKGLYRRLYDGTDRSTEESRC